MPEIRARLQDIFRQVFDDDALVLEDRMSAPDVDGWDSLQHINLIIAVEKAFRITFATAEISRLSDADQSVGTFIALIEKKARST